jgi:hypothetical protein
VSYFQCHGTPNRLVWGPMVSTSSSIGGCITREPPPCAAEQGCRYLDTHCRLSATFHLHMGLGPGTRPCPIDVNPHRGPVLGGIHLFSCVYCKTCSRQTKRNMSHYWDTFKYPTPTQMQHSQYSIDKYKHRFGTTNLQLRPLCRALTTDLEPQPRKFMRFSKCKTSASMLNKLQQVNYEI